MAGSTQERNPGGNYPERKKGPSRPDFVLEDNVSRFSVTRRGVRTHLEIDPYGFVLTLATESLQKEDLDPRLAESAYVNASLELLMAMNQHEAAGEFTDTEQIAPEQNLLEARDKYDSALKNLIDSGYGVRRIKAEVHRQLATQITNMGLSYLGEPVFKTKGHMPIFDQAVDDYVRKTEDEQTAIRRAKQE